MAAGNNDASVTHALLAAGTDPTTKDLIGWTPLHVAASTNTNAVTEALLAAGADPNATGGTTAAFHCTMRPEATRMPR